VEFEIQHAGLGEGAPRLGEDVCDKMKVTSARVVTPQPKSCLAQRLPNAG
jgi:hypothetical protein